MSQENKTLNLEILKKTRTNPKNGDIFALKVKAGGYYFGRVIDENIKKISNNSACHGGILIYLYKDSSPIKDHLSIQMKKENLLLPPIITLSSIWTKGIFETIGNEPLSDQDIFDIHCFHQAKGNVDRFGRTLNPIRTFRKSISPCGRYGFTGWKTIDQDISKVLDLDMKTRIYSDSSQNSVPFFSENSAALDWITNIESASDLIKPIDDLVIDTSTFIDAEKTSKALTAAEIICYINNKESKSIVKYIQHLKIKDYHWNESLNSEYLKKSLISLAKIEKFSEYNDDEMWADKEYKDRWNKSLQDLKARLESI